MIAAVLEQGRGYPTMGQWVNLCKFKLTQKQFEWSRRWSAVNSWTVLAYDLFEDLPKAEVVSKQYKIISKAQTQMKCITCYPHVPKVNNSKHNPYPFKYQLIYKLTVYFIKQVFSLPFSIDSGLSPQYSLYMTE